MKNNIQILVNGKQIKISEETTEEAEQEVAKRKAIQAVKIYIVENFGVFEPNWGDSEQEKWTIWYDYEDEELASNYDGNGKVKEYSPFGYLKSEADCEQLIADMEAELKIIWEI